MTELEQIVLQHDARSQLHKDQMIEHGGDLDWLRDPSIIPGRITQYDQPHIDDPFLNAGNWMIDRLTDWCLRMNPRLDYARVFDEYGLSNEQRVAVRTMMNDQARVAFAPGVSAMTELFTVVPNVAVRDGVEDPNEWAKIASNARKFGVLMARNGTFVQGLLRTYFVDEITQNGDYVLGEEHFVLDENTGITTTTSITTLVGLAEEAIKATRPGMEDAIGGTCPAIYAPVKALGGKTMYNAIWDAYTDFAGKHLYTDVVVDPDELMPAIRPTIQEVTGVIDDIAYEDLMAIQERHRITPMAMVPPDILRAIASASILEF